jgi:hypothetical protein
MLQRHALKNVQKATDLLAREYGWFRELPPDRQFHLAVRFAGHQKISLQLLRLFNGIIPWIIALVALLLKG